jgi:hypothetical protein
MVFVGHFEGGGPKGTDVDMVLGRELGEGGNRGQQYDR